MVYPIFISIFVYGNSADREPAPQTVDFCTYLLIKYYKPF